MALEGGFSFPSHLTKEETEAQEIEQLAYGHPVYKEEKQDSGPAGGLDPVSLSTTLFTCCVERLHNLLDTAPERQARGRRKPQCVFEIKEIQLKVKSHFDIKSKLFPFSILYQ